MKPAENDPTLLSLSDAADLIATRAISSRELTKACLDRISGSGKALNAFIAIDPEFALNQADATDTALAQSGPASKIHGVPLAHKDMYYRPGRVTTGSSLIRRHFVPDRLATTLKRLDTAGGVDLGTLMLQEFCLGVTGKDAYFGQCHNPHSPDHIPGGSSGGSGVAVAGGLVFASLGSDTNGSIRIPASANGIVGLKPTKGRVSRYGAMPLSASMDTLGPLARTVRDVARILAVIAGADECDPTALHVPVPDYEDGIDRPLKGRKLGIFRGLVEDNIEPDVNETIEQSVRRFIELGCEVKEVAFPLRAACDDFGNIIVKCEGAGIHRNWLMERPQDYARQARGRLEAGMFLPAGAYWQALSLRKHILQEFLATTMAGLDAVIMPMFPFPLPTIEALEGGGLERALSVTAAMTKFTRPIGYLGLPSLCVPAGLASGLPTAVQLIGRPFAEATLFNLGHQFTSSEHEVVSGRAGVVS
jgi:aspartyl-tRNA(Asn)/glutamyl-tRNA(Gln) amidotransferase subunit A